MKNHAVIRLRPYNQVGTNIETNGKDVNVENRVIYVACTGSIIER